MVSLAHELNPPAPSASLTRNQIRGFWASWGGWTLDGMDSVVYALVLVPALRELLPHSGIVANKGNIGYYGSLSFALFLIGWGLAFLWGPIGDKFGRVRTLMLTIVWYSVFTFLSAFVTNVWQLAILRLLAGIGIGGEWAMGGTFVAEEWPENRRRMGAGFMHTGYYVGFFLAALANYAIGSHYGWRWMFVVGGLPALLLAWIRHGVVEPVAWKKRESAGGHVGKAAAQISSYGVMLISFATILGCLAMPSLAERLGRRGALAFFFTLMMVFIALTFGKVFYLGPSALPWFFVCLFFLGLGGANFAVYTLWLPEQYPTECRASAFAFATSFARFGGAGITFLVGSGVRHYGSLGMPVAMTSIAFALGLLLIPFAAETRGQHLPG